MPVSALYEYYNICDKDLPAFGWSDVRVCYCINLTADGSIDSIVPLFDADVRYAVALLPTRTISTTDTSVLEHRCKYIFGFDTEKTTIEVPCVVNDKTRSAFKKFAETHKQFFADLDSPVCKAFYNFLHKWNPDNEVNNIHVTSILRECKKDKRKKATFVFNLSGYSARLEQDSQFINKYNTLFCENKSMLNRCDLSCTQFNDLYSKIGTKIKEPLQAMCPLSGEVANVAATHKDIFGMFTDKANTLVSYNQPTYCSYNKKGSYNSGISAESAHKYTTAMTALWRDENHTKGFAGMQLLYFALKANDSGECKYVSNQIQYCKEDVSDPAEVDVLLQDTMYSIANGVAADTENMQILDNNAEFCIIGFKENQKRLAIKYFQRNTFGKLKACVEQHIQDMSLEGLQYTPVLNQLKAALLPYKLQKYVNGEQSKVTDNMCTGLFSAVFNGAPYPTAIYNTMLDCVKRDKYSEIELGNSNPGERKRIRTLVNTRMAFIKAYLNRQARSKGNKEEFKMSLDCENKNVAYLCGRLFATLERVQDCATEGTLSTKFATNLAGACKAPNVVLTQMLRISSYYLSQMKSEGLAIYFKKLIAEILNKCGSTLPKYLGLEAQGAFLLGYHQQMSAFYTKKNKVTENGDVTENIVADDSTVSSVVAEETVTNNVV